MLLLVSLALPTALIAIKLALVCSLILIYGTDTKRTYALAKPIIGIALLYSMVGILWSIYGLGVGNPGAARVMTVMAVYPILFTGLGAMFDGRREALERIFIYSAFLLIVMDLAYVAWTIVDPANPLAASLVAMYGDWAVVDDNANYLKFTLPNLSTVLFLLPFFIIKYIHSGRRPLHLFILISLLVISFLSGRRAIYVSSILAIFVGYLATMGTRPTRKRRIGWPGWGTIVVILVAIAFYVYSSEYMKSVIDSIFNFSTDGSNIERRNQLHALWQGFAEMPFFGHGAGAVASYIRSAEQPWSYELFYVSLLFQYGTIGVLIYAGGACWIVSYLIRKVHSGGRDSFEFAYLVGLIAFMIATATNPYLGKFDYMWVLFIPVAMINDDLRNRIRQDNGKTQFV